MKVAYTVWTWLMDPFNKFVKSENKELQAIQFEKACREISFLGYKGVENFNILVDTFGDDVDTLRCILKKYNLDLTAIYTYLKTDFEGEVKMAERCIKLLNDVGADILNLQAPKHAPEGTSREDVLETARKAMIIGKMAYDKGVKLCFHPHWGSTVEKEHEIKYQDRISYMHLKDVDPDITITPERPMNRFRALGQGTVDFKGVYKKLKEIGYDGTICVELDYPIICNYQSAQTSRTYIHDVLGE